MRIRVLGSAAGGGVPQWNCNYEISRLAREGSPLVRVRLQSSIAVAADQEENWVVFNASPDIRQQIAEAPQLQPSADAPLRSTPIAAVVLTNADVDHIAGLLSLRERQAFSLYGSKRVLETLDANSIFRVLDREIVSFRELALDGSTRIEGPRGSTGIVIDTFPVPGKVALFLETGSASQDFNANDGDTVGIRIRSGGKSVAYIPGCADVNDCLLAEIEGCDVLFFDGTVFTDNEMAEAGVGSKTGQRMGHLAISGEGGSLEKLAGLSAIRKIYIHINNTNPILLENSAARAAVEAAGWDIAHDGMEIVL